MTEEVEKGLVNVAGKVLAFFRGLFGRWVTVGGRPVFIKIKTVLKGDVAVKDARAAALAFKKLSRDMRVALGNVRVSNRNIVERALPEKFPPFLLGKKLFQVSKTTTKKSVAVDFPSAPTIFERTSRVNTAGGIVKEVTHGYTNSAGRFIGLPKDAVEATSFFRGPGYITVVRGKRKFIPFFDAPKMTVTSSTQLTIYPGRLRALASLKVSPRRGQRTFPGIDVQDIVNRSAARAIFPSSKIELPSGSAFVVQQFEAVVKKERGVTRYAERLRRQAVLIGEPSSIARRGATENFAELFMIFSRRKSKYKTQWARLQKSHPETIKRFFGIMEIFNVV